MKSFSLIINISLDYVECRRQSSFWPIGMYGTSEVKHKAAYRANFLAGVCELTCQAEVEHVAGSASTRQSPHGKVGLEIRVKAQKVCSIINAFINSSATHLRH